MKKVGLVVGHRPSAQGAVNRSRNVSEYKFYELFVEDLQSCLASNGLANGVIIHRDDTRKGYNKLPGRINKLGFDFIISFHANAYNGRASGSEVLYCSKKGKILADIMQNSQMIALELPNRGLKYRDEEGRGGHLLWNTIAPCVIVEPFFIDNDDDLQRVSSRYEELIEAYAFAIGQFAKWEEIA